MNQFEIGQKVIYKDQWETIKGKVVTNWHRYTTGVQFTNGKTAAGKIYQCNVLTERLVKA